MNNREGYLHDYLVASFIGALFAFMAGEVAASGKGAGWAGVIAGFLLGGVFLTMPGGFVAGYLNFRLHRVGEKLEMEGLSAGFFTAVVYTIISLFTTILAALTSGDAGGTMLAWFISVIFAFLFFSLGGYLSGYLERRPYSMPTVFNLSGISRAPPPPPTAATQLCPTCSQPLTFIQQYNRWYCTNCKKYP
jgi:hypothetical protein